MSIDYCDHLTGVFGHPVAENPGVVIMEAAYRNLGLDKWRFLTIDVLPEDLEGAVKGLRAMGMRGMNLTIPHKIRVIPMLDKLSEEAERIGAVNTIVNDNGVLTGYNTDGKGFMLSLEENGIACKGARIVLLGSGGAARAIGVEACLAGAAEILIVSIEPEQGRALSDALGALGETHVSFADWTPAYSVPAETDILINATPVGLYPDVDACPDINYDSILPKMYVQDVIPNPANTRFLQLAREKGCKTGTGMGMMINQAARNVELWTGLTPDKAVMTEAFLKEIK